MQRRFYRRDAGLMGRMFLVMFLLAALYLGFMAVLWYAGLGFLPVVLIAAVLLGVQYYFSDKLVLASMGAKVVSPQDAP
ncbi:MAG TPA: zinc metalloprotease HtpX, partial [Thermaerobacter sp.]